MPFDSASTVALAMIVRDEAGVLARCLDSVIGVVDEVVIVDTGSLDKTKELALSYADRFPGVPLTGGGRGAGLTLLDFEWCDDFSAARNFGLAHIAADWVLHLDADEELAPSALAPLPELLQATGPLGYYLLIHDMDSDLGGNATGSAPLPPQPTLRLFRSHPELLYKGLVHEYLDIPDAHLVHFTELAILHHSGSCDPAAGVRRSRRNIALLESTPKEPAGSHLDSYTLGLLANEYRQIGEHLSAIRTYRSAIESASDKTKLYLLPLHRDRALSLLALGRERDALRAVKDAQKLYPAYTDLYLIEGDIHLAMRDRSAARRAFLRCLQMGDPPAGYLTLGGTGSWRAEAALARLGQ